MTLQGINERRFTIFHFDVTIKYTNQYINYIEAYLLSSSVKKAAIVSKGIN